MAQVNNPRKAFQFSVILPGLNPFLVQQIKTPDLEFDSDEHGEGNLKIKTAGQINYSTITLSKISPVEGLEDYFQNWANLIQNPLTGGGGLPSTYKRTIVIEQKSHDGVTTLKRWQYLGVWPRRQNGIEFNRTQSGNTIEQIELEVDQQVI